MKFAPVYRTLLQASTPLLCCAISVPHKNGLAALADARPTANPGAVAQPIDLFMASLRTAWKDGGMRPTDRPVVKAKRGRRRPDPLVRVTPDLRKWFEAEPWRTSSELLSRLQEEYPGAYPGKASAHASASSLRSNCPASSRPHETLRPSSAGQLLSAQRILASFEDVFVQSSARFIESGLSCWRRLTVREFR